MTEETNQKILERELQELDKQRSEVEYRLRGLESKERQQNGGRPSG